MGRLRRVKAPGGGSMKSNYFKVLAVALLLAVVAAIGVSQTVKRVHMRGDGMFAGPEFGGHMLAYFTRKLDLTDAQQAQVKDIMAKEKPVFRPLLLQMAQHHQLLRWVAVRGRLRERQ